MHDTNQIFSLCEQSEIVSQNHQLKSSKTLPWVMTKCQFLLSIHLRSSERLLPFVLSFSNNSFCKSKSYLFSLLQQNLSEQNQEVIWIPLSIQQTIKSLG